MHPTKKPILSTLVIVILISTVPDALAKAPPDKLVIIDFTNEIEFVIDDKEFVNKIWTSYSPMGWLLGDFGEKKDVLEGLSKYGFRFIWSDNRGSMPVTYYYVSGEFPNAPAKESFIVFPGDDPRYVSEPAEAFNQLIHMAYVSAKEPGSLPDLERAPTPEQLEECDRLNIPMHQCSEQMILEKISSGLNRNPNTPQPNPLLNSDMLVVIGILGAIFGSLSFLFILNAKGKKEDVLKN